MYTTKQGDSRAVQNPSDLAGVRQKLDPVNKLALNQEIKAPKIIQDKKFQTGVLMALISEYHPNRIITDKMLGPIQEAMFDLLEHTPDPLPYIHMGKISAGAVYISCKGQSDANWLLGLDGRIIHTIRLKVLPAKDLPKPIKKAFTGKNFVNDRVKENKLAKKVQWDTYDPQNDFNILHDNMRRQMEYGIRMAIMVEKYPKKVIKRKMLPALHTAILDLQQKTEAPNPGINVDENIVDGVLYIDCKGRWSANWLHGLDGLTIDNKILKVLPAREVPKPVKMVWKTKNVGCLNIPRVLNMLHWLNPELRTIDWFIERTRVEITHTRRIVCMNKKSADIIKEKGFKLPAGIDNSHFKLLEEAHDYYKIKKKDIKKRSQEDLVNDLQGLDLEECVASVNNNL